ncbi:TPA: hypothetical protein DIC40_08600 [Patescibacteria group bacterium]|nr:hypothetical protein [Candidatus Gracilibacteria bacterium]
MSGTVLVKDIDPRLYYSSTPSILTSIGNKLYFSAINQLNGNELRVTDGIINGTGTYLVKDLWSGSQNSNPSNIVSLNNILYFTAQDQLN